MEIQLEPALPTQIKRNDAVVVGFQVTGGAGESGLLSNPEISRTPAIPSPPGADLAESGPGCQGNIRFGSDVVDYPHIAGLQRPVAN